MQLCVEACRVIGKSVFHKGAISRSDADWLWCTSPVALLTHIHRSDIDSNMAPLSHSLTSRQPAGASSMWLVAGGVTQATKEAAATVWSVGRGAVEPASQSAIDLCGFGGPCLWGHLPQMTDYYRLCWDLGHEKTPSTITLYGRDISNKIPISSKREKQKRRKERFLESFRQREAISFLSSPSCFFLPSFLSSKSPLILELHKWDLPNRLTPFISSLCHYTSLSLETALCSFVVPTVCGRMCLQTGISVTSDFCHRGWWERQTIKSQVQTAPTQHPVLNLHTEHTVSAKYSRRRWEFCARPDLVSN